MERGGCVQLAGAEGVSYFVVDVGRALRRHLLHNVDRVSVVPADLFVVRAVGRVRRPERNDDVARLGPIVVGAADAPAASPFGTGEGGQRQRGVVGVRVLGVPPSVAHDADHGSHQQQEGGASRGARDEGDVGGLQGPILVAAALATEATVSSRLGGVTCATWKKSQSHLCYTPITSVVKHMNAY